MCLPGTVIVDLLCQLSWLIAERNSHNGPNRVGLETHIVRLPEAILIPERIGLT